MKDPKYKTGQYIAGKDTILLLIVAVIPGKPHLYAVSSAETYDHLHWMTEYQFEEASFVPVEPQPARFMDLQAGDMLQASDGYMKILARHDNAILVSQIPDQGAGSFLKMIDTLRSKDEVGSVELPDGIEQALKNQRSMQKAHLKAGGWHDLRTLWMFNWVIVSEADHAQNTEA